VFSFMNKTFITTLFVATALCAASGFAKDKEMKTGGMAAAFIVKAASGGMTEVELGKLAAEKGASQEVKDFGNQMVKDHSKTNDERKEVAGKMNMMVPEKLTSSIKR
jgi:predicted outer membrane protein